MNSLPNPADPGDPRHRIPDGQGVPDRRLQEQLRRRRFWRKVAFWTVAAILAAAVIAGVWLNAR